jgi:subtilisin family serine protease
MRVYPNLGLVLGFVDPGGAAALAASRQVERVVEAPELSLIRPFATRAARLSAAPTWGIKRLKVNRLWAQGLKGRGVIVGHLDTGIDGAHPALQNAIAAFAEFDLAGDQVPGANPSDSDEHGTHTAGTIVGRSVPKGAFGVAPEAQVASAMVIEGGQVIDRILAGMDWVIENGARILSMSLGLRGFTPAFQTVVDALRNANVLPVIAVGNEGPTTSRSPGNYTNVLSVGAMDGSDEVADFSGSQRFNRPDDPLVPDLVAPGVDVLSCVPNGKFAKMDGSSMATPHVAGLAALLLAAEPRATAGDLEQAILGSCVRPASMLEARGNRGVPDAEAALRILRGAPVAAVA